jgi:hypothetical protein
MIADRSERPTRPRMVIRSKDEFVSKQGEYSYKGAA